MLAVLRGGIDPARQLPCVRRTDAARGISYVPDGSFAGRVPLAHGGEVMDTFWIAMVSGAILLGCALGVASLTSRDDSAEDERMRQELERRSQRNEWDQ